MKLSEHLVEYIVTNLKCHHVFTLTGGGAMFLNDAFGNAKNLRAVYCHHEQAAAMAAVGYAKLHGIGVCVTTTGCGATNAMTGLLDAWQDNTPVLFISGQVKSKETSYLSPVPLRAFGVQEFNIIPVVKHLTKAAYFIDSLDTYRNVLSRLHHDLFAGRPGPVWLDIPMDLQSAQIGADIVDDWMNDSLSIIPVQATAMGADNVNTFKKYVGKALKPVFLVGNGLRLSKGGAGIKILEEIANKTSIPIVSTYLGADYFPNDSKNYFGVVGIKAARVANLIVHNSDLLICIGTRLATSVIGFEYNLFAPKAKIVVIDIDPFEHAKKTINPDLIIQADACQAVLQLSEIIKDKSYESWLALCQAAKSLLPRQEQHSPENYISIYDAVDTICKYSGKSDIVVSDAGSSYYVTSIIFSRVADQRYVTSGAQADMGFGLPAGIGCSFIIDGSTRVHVLTGDGSFQLNIQELQTLVAYQPNVSVYVLNNNGYLSIRATQNSFFPGRDCGTDSSNGVSFPDLEKISVAYGLPFHRFNSSGGLKSFLEKDCPESGPVIIELICPENEVIIPRSTNLIDSQGQLTSAPLSHMAPPLSEELLVQLSLLGLACD